MLPGPAISHGWPGTANTSRCPLVGVSQSQSISPDSARLSQSHPVSAGLSKSQPVGLSGSQRVSASLSQTQTGLGEFSWQPRCLHVLWQQMKALCDIPGNVSHSDKCCVYLRRHATEQCNHNY